MPSRQVDAQQQASPFTAVPDPGSAGSVDDLVARLRLLKGWAGDPSYEWIARRVNAAWTAAGRPASELAGKTTVVDCFRPGRRRLNTQLVVAVVQALHPDPGYVTQWRQALQVIAGQTRAASQVRVHDGLPPDLPGFTGRTAELERLRKAVGQSDRDGAVVICAIAGMAGVGKTQLAIRAGHMLARELALDRVLFVNLRGFHPDAGQPAAEPAAVLDGFLRLLGVPGQQIPHDLAARTAAYRGRLAGTRTLVVLDNAADADQVRPLLPETAGCPTLVTSRRDLAALLPTTYATLDAFTADDAVAFLTRSAAEVPVGTDPRAAARIAHRCGYLPLALGLATGHIRATPGWTLTDHADRLDERDRDQRLDGGVEFAFDLSYRDLPADRQRLLRLLALHPGQDLDVYAAAALAGTDLAAARTGLRDLCRDHLVQQTISGRYTFHDLVRHFAAGRARDEDPPAHQRVALTRLFDFYLAAAAAGMDALYPAESHRRPRIAPPATPVPALADPDAARRWLDTELPSLVAVAARTANHGWPAHTTRLSSTLARYLAGGHYSDALTVHGLAHDAAEHAGDPAGQAHALTSLGAVHLRLGQYGSAAEHLGHAVRRYREAGDPAGQGRALTNLGVVEGRLGLHQPATEHLRQALALYRQTGDRVGQARVLINLGVAEVLRGRPEPAADHLQRALALCRQTGDRAGEADALNNLGDVEGSLGRHRQAIGHLQQALTLNRQLGHRAGQAAALDSLGTLHTALGEPGRATEYHQQTLAVVREIGDRMGEACALNGLGEAAHAAGRPADARTHHSLALAVATDVGERDQQARAHAGLGQAHRLLAEVSQARHHYQHALTLYTDLGAPWADEVRDQLNEL
jgi:tetratricopeptide (TPR) repeat protein